MTVPTIEWSDGTVRLIDQTLLAHTEEVLEITSPEQMVDAIKRLAVRVAPAIGVDGAYGVALAARRYGPDGPEFETAVAHLRDARPKTANVSRMPVRAATVAAEGPDRVLEEADAIRREVLEASVAMGDIGADLVLHLVGDRPIRAMTLCNAGGLATVERGTALAVIQTL